MSGGRGGILLGTVYEGVASMKGSGLSFRLVRPADWIPSWPKIRPDPVFLLATFFCPLPTFSPEPLPVADGREGVGKMVDDRTPLSLGPENLHHVEAASDLQKPMRFEKSQCTTGQPGLLRGVNRLGRAALGRRTTCFHLDKHHRSVVHGDNVYFGQGSTETSLDNPQSFFSQIPGRSPFSPIAQSVTRIGPRDLPTARAWPRPWQGQPGSQPLEPQWPGP